MSHEQENKKLIKRFENVKGRSLVSYLKSLAWDEDVECKTAYYLIKSPDNEIALFFSLKCGALFDPLDEELIKEKAERAQKWLQIVKNMHRGCRERELAIQFLENFRSRHDIPLEQIKK